MDCFALRFSAVEEEIIFLLELFSRGCFGCTDLWCV